MGLYRAASMNSMTAIANATGGWPSLSLYEPPQLGLPQPLRFSKAGDLERLRHEMK
jgi:hypothetical protein